MATITRGTVQARPTPEVVGVRDDRARDASLDNLKSLLVAGIIAGHALMGYTEFGSWTYQAVREVEISGPTELILVISAAFGSFFLMGVFFLIGGLLAARSLQRRGTASFVRSRLLRLGIPFAFYTLVVWPVLEYALLEPILGRGPYWETWMNDEPFLDNGPIWFVGVLLLFSLVYAGWRRSHGNADVPSSPLTTRTLVVVAAAVAAGTFAVRLALPIDSGQPLNSHIWQWPQCVAAFGLGVAAARRGWLYPVGDALYRRAATATALGAVAVAALIASAEPLGLDLEVDFGGWRATAIVPAVLEGVVAVAGPIWVLGWAQRHLARTGPLRRAAARSAYVAFMAQGPVLVGLMVAFRPLDLPGDVKALAVATFGILLSFWLAWILVSRTRLGRVL